MKKILIGNTGLIGQTLKDSLSFDIEFNSSTIQKYNQYDVTNSELYLSCLPATKWRVNQDIATDLTNLSNIYNVIKQSTYSKVVLISTIDVYTDSPIHSDETTIPVVKNVNYGSNRYLFELLIQGLNCNNIQVYRLPALFGTRIKKNILYDLLHNNNIDRINTNSYYQWFNLDKLVATIESFNSHGTYNLFTEPIHTSKLYELFDREVLASSISAVHYDYKTKLSKSGYLYTSDTMILEIKKFIDDFRSKSLTV